MEPRGRMMCLDIGTKRTGVAITDEYRIISTPFDLVVTKDKGEWIRQVKNLVEKEEVVELLVGLPLNQHGEEGNDAKKIREYIALLRKQVTIPVIEWDERFTTVQAENALLEGDVSRQKRKETIDKVAA